MLNTVQEAFRTVDRRDFLPQRRRSLAGLDRPLPIGYGQTNSQPSTVLQMLELLDVRPDQKVLDVGSGSGWTSALLGRLVGGEGKVVAIERIPELVEWSRDNLDPYNLPWVGVYDAQPGELGMPEWAPYDRILVSAAAETLPSSLVGQLRVGGRMVIPILNDLVLVTKTDEDETKEEHHFGYTFVPLLEE